MNYEEKLIDGVLMFRTSSKGKWMFMKKDLSTVIGNIILNA